MVADSPVQEGVGPGKKTAFVPLPNYAVSTNRSSLRRETA